MTRKILRHAGLILLILLLLAGCGRRTADPAAENAESVSQTLSLLPEAESASEETTQSGGEDAGSSGENTSAAESASSSENAAGEESVSGSGNASGEESAEDPAGAGGEESAEESGGTDTAPESGTADGGLTVTEDGWYSSKEEVALYIHTYGKLPENFLTKREAEELGWDKSYGSLWRVAPGMSIGGSRFGNYEKLLPEKKGRKYFECDIDYNGKTRGAKRIVFSNDGLVYYTGDHYESFELLYGEP